MATNVFQYYSGEENSRFTNSLLSLLELSQKYDRGRLLSSFLKLAGITTSKKGGNFQFKVLKEVKGTYDWEISNSKFLLAGESKKDSASLDDKLEDNHNQIRRHMRALDRWNKSKKIRKLALLTPDDSRSEYVSKFIKIAPSRICHVSWKDVYQEFGKYKTGSNLFSELVRQFLLNIKENIFENDKAGVIVKINFGTGKNHEKGSSVNPDTYLKEMKNGEWGDWHTHSQYKELDGTGRKLLLYDPKRKEITIEVEIERVKYDPKHDKYFCWSNRFVSSKPKFVNIPLQKILRIPKTTGNIRLENKDGKSHGFCNFLKTKTTGSQTAGWNLTREQYNFLVDEL